MTAPTNQSEERTITELLRQWFYAAVPTDRLITQSMQDMLAELQRDLLPLSGQPLGTVLLNPQTETAILVALKNHGKRQAQRENNQTASYHAALALYFAAIASALVFHGEKISTHSYVTLAAAFDTLRRKPWMVTELGDLLARAQTVCTQRQPPAADRKSE